jgi:hypothetical protein
VTKTPVTEIRVYVEGGGDSNSGKSDVRRGFRQFLSQIIALARVKNIGWNITACGNTKATKNAFTTALRQRPTALNILIVDSDGPFDIDRSSSQHLFQKDEIDTLNISDEQCHLMVQVMETWLVADVNALMDFYGNNFNDNPIPKRQDIEQVGREEIYRILKEATKKTQKGEYHKINHGLVILGKVDVATVRRKAPHCEQLFATLTKVIAES